MKKGLSFTLTLVVVGVILLMTALSVITLGGSSINQFFETIGGEQEQAVQQNAIAEACREKMERIEREYCSQYVQSATYEDADHAQSEPWNYQDYMNNSGDEWVDHGSQYCGTTQAQQEPRGYNLAEAGESAWDETASDKGCSWVANYENPTVNVEGQTFDCIQEGVVDDGQCPAN